MEPRSANRNNTETPLRKTVGRISPPSANFINSSGDTDNNTPTPEPQKQHAPLRGSPAGRASEAAAGLLPLHDLLQSRICPEHRELLVLIDIAHVGILAIPGTLQVLERPVNIAAL